LFIEVATAISAAVSVAFAPASMPCSCGAALCSTSCAGFFLLLGASADLEAIDDFEDE